LIAVPKPLTLRPRDDREQHVIQAWRSIGLGEQVIAVYLMRLALACVLFCSACAHTRPVTPPPPPSGCAARVITHRRRPDAFLPGKRSVDRDVWDAELSRFPDAKLALTREHALYASGWSAMGLGMALFTFGIWPAYGSGNDRAVDGIGGTTAALFVSGIVMATVSYHFRDRALARYNAQIDDRCPRPLDEDFPP